MKKPKERVIAIDYFRGIFIIMPVVNHAMLFSMPFAYLTGASRLWTSAAELLLIISGLTFGVIRADQIKSSFTTVYKKTWRRVGQIYLINLLVVALSLLLALFAVSHSLTNDVDGVLPNRSGLSLLWSIINLSYSIGWGGFLGLFAVFLAGAPFALYVIRTRAWLAVPILSIAIYALNNINPSIFGSYAGYAMWQLYFIMGIVLSKFRVPALTRFGRFNFKYRQVVASSVMGLTLLLLGMCVLLEDNNILYPRVAHMAAAGWLPAKTAVAYQHLLLYKPTVDSYLMDSRHGFLRPVFAFIVLGGMYAAFYLYRSFWLAKTGRVMTIIGKDTLVIFASQAIIIPILAFLPLQHNLVNNALLTGALLLSIWYITQRRVIFKNINAYALSLKKSYEEAKYAYLYGTENDS